ncbi:TolC family protein [Erythrobacter dokdonensis]|jgi:outer membrane protein TolC|uniref:Outer membrane efflux protein n=1 Tax=Erythrobacter dokdonensis DSW-74 TaxID=1300349 RepID=A0A1A7BGQ1_9SPHN|nr:TolC family protein [Erythrobacter dokdonensis]MEE4318128.1 TolC family protein [Erythrobacter sp.]OBV10390.1 Outer membrane efflux protein [Erythrobacter dokdonensis DSW-74]
MRGGLALAGWPWLACGAALLALAPAAALAQDIAPLGDPIEEALTTGPLLPEEVLRSSALTFPSILEAFEREAAARSDQLAADGAFDLMLKGEAYDRVTGTFSGGFAKAEARQPLRPLGAEVFGSYRVSDGRFPIYENINNTNQLGEVKVGALFSLLRNRDIDSRRFGIEDTRLAASQAQLDVMLVQLNVQHEALRAYWRWVAAGEEIRVFEELLEIAEARQVGLAREVSEGARPRIALTENEQNLLIRRSLLEEAKRNFLIAANSLGFYLRGSDGKMIVPTREMLPDQARMEAVAPVEELVATPVSEVIQRRPELQTFKLALERANNRVALRRNDLQPRLDASVELSRDFGAIGDGGPTFDSTDTVVGLTFTVPLQRREARGRLQRAEAELRETELRQRRIADQITTEVSNIIDNLSAALRIADLADAEVKQANTMVQAERTRFRLGAGEFFLVNAREEAAANAQVKAIRAKLAGRLAEASYNAATMNLDALGLE